MAGLTFRDVMLFEEFIVNHQFQVGRSIFRFRDVIELTCLSGAGDVSGQIAPCARNCTDDIFELGNRLANIFASFRR